MTRMFPRPSSGLAVVLAIIVSLGCILTYHTHVEIGSEASLSTGREGHTRIPVTIHTDCLLCQMAGGAGKVLSFQAAARYVPTGSGPAWVVFSSVPALWLRTLICFSRAPPISI